MKRLLCTLVLALTTLVTANFAVAASNPLEPQLNPRLEFAQWYPTSLVCQTPTFWCWMAAPGFVGNPCSCGLVSGVIVPQ